MKIRWIFISCILMLLLSGCSNVNGGISNNSNSVNEFSSEEKTEKETRVETENFTLIAYEENTEYLEDVKLILEEKIDKIKLDFKLDEVQKVNITFYPTMEEYHIAYGKPDAPDWVVGNAVGSTEVKMVSLNGDSESHDYESLLKVVVHELTHCYSAQINPSIWKSRWISEGIAKYEAEQMPNPERLKEKIDIESIPKLRNINRTDEENLELVYIYGYDLIEFVVNTWGIDTIPELIKNNGNISEVIGITQTEFDNQFKEYFVSKYFSNVVIIN